MTRKEQLKKMTLTELEAQKQFILNGRVSFEDQVYSAELDDEIRLREQQEREKNACTCQRFKELNERINIISKTGDANAKIFAERLALTRKALEEQQRFIEDLKNDAAIDDLRLDKQAETLDVIFNNYRSQNEKMLKLEAAIKELRHYESEDSIKQRRDNREQRKEAAKKAITENDKLSRILERTEDIEESICGLKRYMKEKDGALKFLIFVDVAITASLMAVMYKYILFM